MQIKEIRETGRYDLQHASENIPSHPPPRRTAQEGRGDRNRRPSRVAASFRRAQDADGGTTRGRHVGSPHQRASRRGVGRGGARPPGDRTPPDPAFYVGSGRFRGGRAAETTKIHACGEGDRLGAEAEKTVKKVVSR